MLIPRASVITIDSGGTSHRGMSELERKRKLVQDSGVVGLANRITTGGSLNISPVSSARN